MTSLVSIEDSVDLQTMAMLVAGGFLHRRNGRQAARRGMSLPFVFISSDRSFTTRCRSIRRLRLRRRDASANGSGSRARL